MTDRPICPARSPETDSPCALEDTAAAHCGGHESELIGISRAVWATLPEERQRWAEQPAVEAPAPAEAPAGQAHQSLVRDAVLSLRMTAAEADAVYARAAAEGCKPTVWMRRAILSQLEVPGPVIPPLPPEPPDGAICRGDCGDLWQRRDDWAGSGRHWFRGGISYRYGAAIDAGLNPAKRLYEIPDPADEQAIHALTASMYASGAPPMDGAAAAVVRKLLYALTDRGQP